MNIYFIHMTKVDSCDKFRDVDLSSYHIDDRNVQ